MAKPSEETVLMHTDSSPAEPSLRAVRRALRNDEWASAEEFAGHALASGVPVRRLQQAFTAAGKLEILVRVAWEQRNTLFNDLGKVRWFAQIAAGMQAADEVFANLEQWALDRSAPQFTFCHRDHLIAHNDLGERALAALFCVKYGAWDLGANDALQKAAECGDRFCVKPETAEFFYRHRRDSDLEFSDWLREWKRAQMLDQLLSDALVAKRFRGNPNPSIRKMAKNLCRMANLREYADVAEAKHLFEGLDRSRGLLISTFHSGFLMISNFLFVTAMPDAYCVTRAIKGEKSTHAIPVRDNEHAGAFRTVKALGQGKAVLMAPDGPHYGNSSGATIEVLGLKTTISQGAAVIAYEANCDTGWISAVRRGRMFVPQYVAGPRRAEGEHYKAFRDRWLSFYAQCIEKALSSEPENLVPNTRWASPHSQIWN